MRPPGFRGDVLTAEADVEPYASASGVLRANPRGVAVPRDARDAAALVRWAARESVPLIPRGAGTGMPGGNVGPGLAVDLVRGFRRVLSVDPDARLARVEPGVTLAELNAACGPHRLRFPVDPSSGERCTLGGMIANNAGGAHSVRYGATRAWVQSLDVVLADGSLVTTTRGESAPAPALARILEPIDHALRPEADRIESEWPRVRKNSSGYALRDYLRGGDAVDLIVGSEGTLALVVAADLRLDPVPPHRGVALLEFATLEAAGEAVEAILATDPATCEMLDGTFLDLVREAGASPYPLAPDLQAILLVEMEGESPEEVEQRLHEVESAARGRARRVSLAVDPERQERFWALRHAASPLIAARAGDRVSMQFIEDGVVPVSRLADYVRLLREVLHRSELPAVIFGHAGDGNLHVNPLVDVSRPGWRDTLERVLLEVAHGIARLGGTLAGEHGDGRLRAPLLETVWGAPMVRRFRLVKHAFDPRGILNPGVILPLPGQRPFDHLPAFD